MASERHCGRIRRKKAREKHNKKINTAIFLLGRTPSRSNGICMAKQVGNKKRQIFCSRIVVFQKFFLCKNMRLGRPKRNIRRHCEIIFGEIFAINWKEICIGEFPKGMEKAEEPFEKFCENWFQLSRQMEEYLEKKLSGDAGGKTLKYGRTLPNDLIKKERAKK